ncbi:MAG: hypothetical protein U9R57_01195 [Thermodesulfobacteriota bacterium]|nr:hypothetical protein [Thermodesulfobacteriota bacterium]
MTQQSGSQFDDGSYATDSIDLFEFTGDEETPIAKLKTIILSIDWEISDDILQQLDDELVDLGDIWAGDKIKQVYVQGLSNIGKYINNEKANAHPSAIKLLITFYHNLEKIVSSDDLMSEDEKKQLLLKDVKLFDQLKKQIGISGSSTVSGEAVSSDVEIDTDETDHLKALKAYVLGLDWEINDEELQKLDDEVQRLEGVFSQDKAKLILLQGIGALSSYINKMRSQANGKVFTLLHSFYGTLETITESQLSPDDQKQLLLSEVEKFNAFKLDLTAARSESAEVLNESTPAEDVGTSAAAVVPVAFADDENDEENEKVAYDVELRLDAVFGDDEDQKIQSSAEGNIALEGVNVETDADDDSDEESLPYEGDTVAPALSEVEEESSFSVEKLAGDLAQSVEPDALEDDDLVDDSILQGVDVETEADDDSDEDALLFEDDELAPALTGSSGDGGFDEGILADELEESDSESLENRLDSFFDAEVQSSSDEWGTDKEREPRETEVEGQDIVAALSEIPAPALNDNEEISTDEEAFEEAIEERLSFFDEESSAPQPDTSVDQREEGDFSDEEIQVPDSSDSEESSIDNELSFFDDDAPVPALSDDTESPHVDEAEDDHLLLYEDETEQLSVEKETVEESSDEALAVFDEDVPGREFDDGPVKYGETVSVDSEEFSDSEEIEFTVPDEDDSSETPLASTEEPESEEVTFEVVSEDVEVDPLPGEEYVDSTSTDFADDGEAVTDNVTEYLSMGSAIVSLQENISENTLQDLFAEINRSRNHSPSNYIEKIFLQLLSTICQHVERNIDDTDAASLSLMDDVYSGLKMSSSVGVATEQVHQHLLACTSKVLLLQEKDIRPA